MGSATIVVTECDHDAFNEEEAIARAEGFTFRVEQSTPETLIENCQDADAILVQYAKITAEVMDQLPRLKAIGRYGVGVDSVDVEAATKRGIVVCNVPAYGTEAVSDHAVALALTVSRGIARLDRGLREGRVDLPAIRPLHICGERVFGVIGLGRIGRATARKAAGFGWNVIGYDLIYEPGSTVDGIDVVSFEELIKTSQIISLHVPLNDATRNLIDAAELAQMRDDCVLINTARGGVINTDALVAALEEGSIGGAGLDCHDIEPMPVDHPLTRFDNVTLTPHLAWYSEESYGELKRQTMQGVADVLANRKPSFPVNPEVFEGALRGERTQS